MLAPLLLLATMATHPTSGPADGRVNHHALRNFWASHIKRQDVDTKTTVYRELGGYLLGQEIEPVKKSLGEPEETSDEGDVLVYHRGEGDEDHLVLISDDDDPKEIVSIVVDHGGAKGEPNPAGLEIGESRADAEAKVGKDAEYADDDGETIATYKDRNLALRFAEDKLIGIAIYDDEDIAAEPEENSDRALPSLAALKKALDANDTDSLVTILAGNLEIYLPDDESAKFDGSPRKQLADPESKIYKALYGPKGLKELLTDSLAGTEVKDVPDEDGEYLPIPTAKFGDEVALGDISFRWELGGWRVWTVDLSGTSDSRRG